MELRSLGRTGVKVSPLCLGAMMFGAWGETDHEASIRIIHRALDAGINFIDTADVYARGESETIVGKALAGGRRDDVVLATKFHGTMGDDVNEAGNSRRWIYREVEASLRRLGTDWIDLYQVHRWDPWTDHEETLGALSDLVAQGKVRYVGSSTYPAHQVVEAQWVSRTRGLGRFVTEQPPYSMLVRGIERDLLPVAAQYDMGVLPWSPLAGGWLSGRFRLGAEAPESHRAGRMPARYDLSTAENQLKLERADALAKVAESAGISLV
ncbi:MAG: aldo/keto reductase, partial [Solirubrobacteraceae bacterium]